MFNYMGRKITDVAKLLVESQGEKFAKIIEPFAGSAIATRQFINEGVARKGVIGEANPVLLNIFEQIKNNPESVLGKILEKSAGIETGTMYNRPNRITPEGVASIRNMMRQQPQSAADTAAKDYIEAAVAEHYVPNKSGGNLIRPGMHMKSPEALTKDVEAYRMMLAKTKVHPNWKKAVAETRPDDMLFVDPPYLGTRGYGKGGFQETEMLAATIKELMGTPKKGVIYNSAAGAEKFPFLNWKKTNRPIDEYVAEF